jgi:hypothetical protein
MRLGLLALVAMLMVAGPVTARPPTWWRHLLTRNVYLLGAIAWPIPPF